MAVLEPHGRLAAVLRSAVRRDRCFGLARRAAQAADAHSGEGRRRRDVRAGADTGDRPGEFQHWVERREARRVHAFPQGYRDLRMNDAGVLGVVTGVGTARAAATIMALGLDPRFDLRKAYWVVAGIAGIDPEDASLGRRHGPSGSSTAISAHEIDAREIPAGWKTGMVPLRKSVPYEQPKETATARRCSASTPAWSSGPTSSRRTSQLDETEQMEASARAIPARSRGGRRSCSRATRCRRARSGSGAKLTEWANDWVRDHTGGRAAT